MKNTNKILVILGPTATGKSDLAVKLALRLNSGKAKEIGVNGAEIISADSRQVYKGLNIGTGKITKKEMYGVTHYMLDVISPKKVFSVSDWQKQTQKIIKNILLRGKLPIICGGTGFYIQSIVDDIVLPEAPPNIDLRKKLNKKTLPELISILKKLDPKRLKNIDSKNPVRLVRAIEIATKLGSVPKITKQKNRYQFLQVGLVLQNEDLRKKINNRLIARIKSGMVKEAENLHENGLSWNRMQELGLEYRYLALFLQKKLSKEQFIQKLETEIWHYAKRQITWFKRDKKIIWFKPDQIIPVEKLVVNFVAK